MTPSETQRVFESLGRIEKNFNEFKDRIFDPEKGAVFHFDCREQKKRIAKIEDDVQNKIGWKAAATIAGVFTAFVKIVFYMADKIK